MTALAGRLAGSSLDDFLAEPGSGSSFGERLEMIGLIESLLGVTLAFGLLVLLARVHRGSEPEVRRLLRLVSALGVLIVVGAVLESIGAGLVREIGWSELFGTATGAAITMRLLGGVLIAVGLYPDIVPVTGGAPDEVRWLPGAASAFGMVGAFVAAGSFAFDGHALSQGPRAVHAFANVVHVMSGGIWFGGVAGLALVAALRRRSGRGDVASLVVRFSSVATVALLVVATAGIGMTLMIADDVAAITSSPWGHRLIVKTSAVAIAVAIGAYNHFRLVPRLDDGIDDAIDRTMRISLCCEAVVLTFVVGVTALLVTASPS